MPMGFSTHISKATFPSKIYVETDELNSDGIYFIVVRGIFVGFIFMFATILILIFFFTLSLSHLGYHMGGFF